MDHRDEGTKEQFASIAHMLPGTEGHVGVTAQDHHNFLNAIFWKFKTGTPWRDLPQGYGDWENIHRRLSRGTKRGVFDKLLQALTDGASNELLLLDSRLVRTHPHAAGAKKASEALARSSGGWSSKIHGALNGQGLPTGFYGSRGEIHDGHDGTLWLQCQRTKYVLGDRAYAGQQLLDPIASIGAEAVIPSDRQAI